MRWDEPSRAAQAVDVPRPSRRGSVARHPVALALVAVLLLGGSVVGYLWYRSAQANRIKLAAKQQEIDRTAERLANQKRALDEQQRKIEALREELSGAVDPGEIERLRRELEKEKSKANQLRSRPPIREAARKPTCGPPGDIMCNDI